MPVSKIQPNNTYYQMLISSAETINRVNCYQSINEIIYN